jgi:hypothetical protein
VKYLEAFLAENQSGKDTKGIEPAKPAKGAFDGFAGATYRDIQAARQPLESASGFDATDVIPKTMERKSARTLTMKSKRSL